MQDEFDEMFDIPAEESEDMVEETTDEVQDEHEEEETTEEVEGAEEEASEEEEESEDIDDEAGEPTIEISSGKEKQTVPLGTFLDRIDKHKADRLRAENAEREVAELRARYENNEERPAFIDPLVDPEGYASQVQETIQTAVFNERLNQCMVRASQKHSPEKLKEVSAWAIERAGNDANFDRQAQTVADPVEFAIQQYEQEQNFQLMISDPEGFARKIAEEKGWFSATEKATQAAPVANRTTAKKAIPRSLTGVATKPSGKSTGRSGDDAFDSIFNNR